MRLAVLFTQTVIFLKDVRNVYTKVMNWQPLWSLWQPYVSVTPQIQNKRAKNPTVQCDWLFF